MPQAVGSGRGVWAWGGDRGGRLGSAVSAEHSQGDVEGAVAGREDCRSEGCSLGETICHEDDLSPHFILEMASRG